MGEDGISLQDLRDRYPFCQLDKDVSEEHMREVPRIVDDHEVVGPELGLAKPEMTEISRDARTRQVQKKAKKCLESHI